MPARAPALTAAAALLGALVLAMAFVAIALPVLASIPHDFDEGWLMVDARLMADGGRPFVDFAHHELPLHLYLLDWSGRCFGATVFGYRMLSLLSAAASGVALVWLARPFVGVVPALVAEAVFLFSPVQTRLLTAVPETPALLCTIVGAALLFGRGGRCSAWASGVAFTTAVVLKPTCLVVVAAAVASLLIGRAWRRLADFGGAGIATAVAALAWTIWISDGIFAEVVRFQLTRIGTHRAGMWAIDSGFADMKQLLGISTPTQWAVLQFLAFFRSRLETLPLTVFALALAAIPIWVFGCARRRPAFAAFAVLWPASLLVLDFLVMDFVSARYFIPFAGFTALLLSGWVWLIERWTGPWPVALAGVAAGVALAVHLGATLGHDGDPWYWRRSAAIAQENPHVISFTPIFYAATGAAPGCGFANSALTYGSFGDNFLLTERTRRFQFTDERLIDCLRADSSMRVVVDWAFYFFTRPGGALRAYLAGEGSDRRVFFSPDAVQQWDRPLLTMSSFR
jgi:hypothetical protein